MHIFAIFTFYNSRQIAVNLEQQALDLQSFSFIFVSKTNKLTENSILFAYLIQKIFILNET